MARQREAYGAFYEGDFGLSALAARLHASSGPVDSPAALLLAADVAGLGAGEGAVELGTDVRLLLDSGVPDEALRTVWRAVTGGRFDPAEHGTDVRGWLSRLAERYPARVREARPRHWSLLPPPVVDEADLREEVVAEIRASAAEGGAFTDPPFAGLPGALETIAGEADADLALRLYLRAVKARRVTVGKPQFDRLAALDERLAYPGPLLYDDLDVRWPPVDPARRDAEGDFGLTELAARFAGPWHEDVPRRVLERAVAADEAGQTPGSAAAALLQDALRLLESSVPTGTITTVWGAASERGYDIERAGLDGRTWLRAVAAACRDHLALVAPSYEPFTTPVRAELADTVLDALWEATPELAGRTVGPHAHPLPGPVVAEAVARVVTEADPDLGFRLFVRLLAVLAVPLTEERYVGIRTLAERFGHGTWHVSEALEFLVLHE
ncbi:hypothetical protein AB0B30_26770 [Streptomyces narbonensis]|uniref:Uncharacterized protein n=1 Tax=Streptomyces narbonensis TaxID=67333 RepID=A0ABV3CI90_9ACTN